MRRERALSQARLPGGRTATPRADRHDSSAAGDASWAGEQIGGHALLVLDESLVERERMSERLPLRQNFR